MYMHLTKVTIERFGRDGEMTIRYGLRAYGKWRGIEMREAHHAMGLEINMKNLIGCWDNASTYIIKDDMEQQGTYKPYDTRFDVHYCPAAEAWKDAEFHQWGHVYCDEFHQACASTYHPDGNVVIPRNLMKGDDHCHFQWIMPPNAEKLDLGEPSELGRKLARDYTASTDIEAAWLSLKRSNRLVGGRFYTHASVILERHGGQAAPPSSRRCGSGVRSAAACCARSTRRPASSRAWRTSSATTICRPASCGTTRSRCGRAAPPST